MAVKCDNSVPGVFSWRESSPLTSLLISVCLGSKQATINPATPTIYSLLYYNKLDRSCSHSFRSGTKPRKPRRRLLGNKHAEIYSKSRHRRANHNSHNPTLSLGMGTVNVRPECNRCHLMAQNRIATVALAFGSKSMPRKLVLENCVQQPMSGANHLIDHFHEHQRQLASRIGNWAIF